MQIVSKGDSLHEMSNPLSWKKYEKYFKMSPAENFTQSTKHFNISGRYICILYVFFLNFIASYFCMKGYVVITHWKTLLMSIHNIHFSAKIRKLSLENIVS